jgi:hypothetical protein
MTKKKISKERQDMLVPAENNRVQRRGLEKNLLEIGYFGAQNTVDPKIFNVRRIEHEITKNGARRNMTIVFSANPEWGFPNISDQDKWLVFLKYIEAQRTLDGRVTNPVRFVANHMIKELGITNNNHAYNAIHSWLQRMQTTQIRADDIIFLAGREKYAETSLIAIQKVERFGDKLKDSRTEEYEVHLADWMLENFNSNYVVPVDATPYSALTLSIAKSLYMHLHTWFRQSKGFPVQRDYAKVCALINLKKFSTPSRIKQQFEPAFDQLIRIGYLQSWELEPMSTERGYKFVLTAGDVLTRFLTTHGKALSRPFTGSMLLAGGERVVLDSKQQRSRFLLIEHGVNDPKATELALECSEEHIQQCVGDWKKKVMAGADYNNNQAVLIHMISPKGKPSATKPQAKSGSKVGMDESADYISVLSPEEEDAGYERWRELEIDQEVERRYPGAKYEKKIAVEITRNKIADKQFAKAPIDKQRMLIERTIRAELEEYLMLMSYDEWARTHRQRPLF